MIFLLIKVSKILPGVGKSDIGLKLLTSDKLPFLGITLTWAIFQNSGKVFLRIH